MQPRSLRKKLAFLNIYKILIIRERAASFPLRTLINK